VNPLRAVPDAGLPTPLSNDSFQGLMGDLLAREERLDVYDEPDDGELEPDAARLEGSRVRRRAPGQSSPFRVFSVFLGGMVTGCLFLALGFWAGRHVYPAKVVPVHSHQESAYVPTKVSPLNSTASAQTPDESRDAMTQPSPGTVAKPGPVFPTAATEQPTGQALDSGFNIQVASPATEQEAEDLGRILKNMGYPVLPTTPAPSGPQRRLFHVRVGPYRTREEAQQVMARLQLEGFKPSPPSAPGAKE
jgi:cell division septation protein DedD